MNSEITIRPATVADRDGIVMYSRLFADLDPMETERFEIYMKSRLRHKFVAEHNGQVVSFLGLMIVDNGRTGFYYGARTREGYTNQYIQTNLLKHAVSEVRKAGFPIERVWLASWDTKYNQQYFNARPEKRLVLRKNMVNLAIPDTSKPMEHILRPWRESLNVANIRQITPEEVATIVESPTLKPLFDEGVIFYDYYCCEPLKSNKDAFLELLILGFIELNDNGDIIGLSTAGTMKTRANKVRFDFNFNTKDLKSTLAHAVRMIEYVLDKYPNEYVEFLFHLDKRSDPVEFEKFFCDNSDNLITVGCTPRELWYSNVVEIKM